jgi:hypothetical protein
VTCTRGNLVNIQQAYAQGGNSPCSKSSNCNRRCFIDSMQVQDTWPEDAESGKVPYSTVHPVHPHVCCHRQRLPLFCLNPAYLHISTTIHLQQVHTCATRECMHLSHAMTTRSLPNVHGTHGHQRPVQKAAAAFVQKRLLQPRSRRRRSQAEAAHVLLIISTAHSSENARMNTTLPCSSYCSKYDRKGNDRHVASLVQATVGKDANNCTTPATCGMLAQVKSTSLPGRICSQQ